MPPRKIIDCTVYIMDCSDNIEEKLQYLHKIFATKYFSQTKSAGKDVQRVIFFNSPKHTAIHIVNDWNVYELETLDVFKKEINVEEAQAGKNENFLKAIITAIECLEDDVIDPKFVKKIVLLTDLSQSMQYKSNTDSQIKYIKENVKNKNIWLYFIGPDVKIPRIRCQKDVLKLNNFSQIDQLSPAQKENFAVAQNIAKQNAIVVDYENGFDILFSHKIDIKMPFPWYVNLAIGKDLKIPIVSARTTRAPEKISYDFCPISGRRVDLRTERAWFDVNTHEEVPTGDVVHGYKFHDEFVTFTPEQQASMNFKTSPKCLSIFAFLGADEIAKNLYFLPNSMSLIRPDMRSSRADDKGFRLFVAGLRARNVVALAKRAYYNGLSPNFFCIFPCPEHTHTTASCLLMAQMPFAHQFVERFQRGRQCKVDVADPDVRMYTFGFLDAMTAGCRDDGRPIHPLAESMKHSRNRVRQCEYLASKNLDQDAGEAPELTPDQLLVERAAEYGDLLMEICQKLPE